MMIGWLYKNYGVIAGIFVPIIIAIIGIFKGESLKKFILRENKNLQFKAGKDVNNNQMLSGNTLNAANNSTQNLAYGNQKNYNIADTKSIEVIANGFISTMYPHTEAALNQLRLNAFKFFSLLEDKLKEFPKDKLDKFSEPDVQIALQGAIKSAARKNSSDIHKTLASCKRSTNHILPLFTSSGII
jgi:hypothetical protein